LKIPKGQNPYIEEEQTTQWQKEKDKQRSTKHTHKIKDRVMSYLQERIKIKKVS
jgi:hypothetical protein